MAIATRRATSLRPGQFKHLLRVASVTGRMPVRDVMLLWGTHTTGIRVTELVTRFNRRSVGSTGRPVSKAAAAILAGEH
jgi:site-specific recombinase XerD